MKYQRNVHQAAMMITQFGIHMLVPIFACTFLGIWLDKKFGTSWIMVVLSGSIWANLPAGKPLRCCVSFMRSAACPTAR